MIVKHSEVMVCVDCLLALANGEESSAEHSQALETFSAECARDGLQIVVTSSEETDNEFSAAHCGACGSHLAGSRHQCALLQNLDLPISDDSAREVISGYQECAQWLAKDEEGESVDHCELSDAARAALADDCVNFLASLRACHVNKYSITGATWPQFGHDFFLTRNRHGAGFWDRGYGAIGERLTELAHIEGERDTMFDDDTNEIEVY